MLFPHPIDVGADVEILGVADLVGGDDPGTLRGGGVQPLAVEPVEPLVPGPAGGPLLDQQLAFGDVVHHRVPGHIAQGVSGLHTLGGPSDDDGQLSLPVDGPGNGRDEDFVLRAGDGGARGLHEDPRRLFVLGSHPAAPLLDVVLVVAGQAEQLARPGGGCFQFHAGEEVCRLAVGLGLVSQLFFRRLYRLARCRHSLAAGGQEGEHVSEKGVGLPFFASSQSAVGGLQVQDDFVAGDNGADGFTSL